MIKRKQTSFWRQQSWCLALALILLFSQFSGQRHRIDHTRWLSDSSLTYSGQASPASYNSGYIDATHSCIALDAASLADGMATALPVIASAVIHARPAGSPVCRRWDAPPVSWFRARAPPLSL